MKRIIKIKVWLFIAFIFGSVLLFCSSCKSIAVNIAKKEMEHTYNSLLGHTQSEVIAKLGAPTDVQHVDGYEIYHYHISYGINSSGHTYYSGYNSFGGASTWESYDDTQVVFSSDGIVVSWKGYVQR